MIALILAAWLYLAAHAVVGTALGAPEGAECTTDVSCGCVEGCLGELP